MSIGPHPPRPSGLHGVQLPPMAPLPAPGIAPAELAPPPRTPSPALVAREVRQLHPAEAKSAPLASARPAPLQRSVATFMLPGDTRFEQDSDAFTAIERALESSLQQQPDTATLSSGEVTPRQASQ